MVSWLNARRGSHDELTDTCVGMKILREGEKMTGKTTMSYAGVLHKTL